MDNIKIKALVWEDFKDYGSKAQAWNDANYMIQKWSDGRWELSASYPGYSTFIEGVDRFHPTIEAAKAAAQADYEARIRSALIATPARKEVMPSDVEANGLPSIFDASPGVTSGAAEQDLVSDVITAQRSLVTLQQIWEAKRQNPKSIRTSFADISKACGIAADDLQNALAALARMKEAGE